MASIVSLCTAAYRAILRAYSADSLHPIAQKRGCEFLEPRVMLVAASFGPSATYATGPSSPYEAAVTSADFDGDGKVDLAVTNSSSNIVSIWRNQGDGTFLPTGRVDLATGRRPASVAAADFNNDERPDLAVANAADGTVSIFLNASTGAANIAFGVAPQCPTSVSPDAEPVCVVAGDFLLGGDIELAVANRADGTVVILTNAGGPFAVGPILLQMSPCAPGALAAGDLDGNGKMDLAVGDSLSSNVRVFFSDSIGLCEFGGPYVAAGSVRSLVCGYADGDDRVDLAVAGSAGVKVLLNSGNRAFSMGPTLAAGSDVSGLAMADANLDGNADLVVSKQYALRILLGDAQGTYSEQAGNVWGVSTLVSPDLNEDGRPDVVVASRHSSTIGVLLNTTLAQIVATLQSTIGPQPVEGSMRFVLYRDMVPVMVRRGSNPAAFSGLSDVEYLLEGYQTGTFFGEEFWTSQSVNVTGGQCQTPLLQRNYPYADAIHYYLGDGTEIPAGSSVEAGTVITPKVTVRNDVPGTTLPCEVHLLLDRMEAPWPGYDYDGQSSPVALPSGISTVVTLPSFCTSEVGIYGAAFEVITFINEHPQRTDSWTWVSAVMTTERNEAPVLDTSGHPCLAPLNLFERLPDGNTVQSIVGGAIQDTNTDPLMGIAVVGTDESYGRWQYSIGGSAWQDMGAVSNGHARLLRDVDRIRFLANQSWAGSATIQFRAWDRTSGVEGELADTSLNGGKTAFSAAAETAKIEVGYRREPLYDTDECAAFSFPAYGEQMTVDLLKPLFSTLVETGQEESLQAAAKLLTLGLFEGVFPPTYIGMLVSYLDNLLSQVNPLSVIPLGPESPLRSVSDKIEFDGSVPDGEYTAIPLLNFGRCGWPDFEYVDDDLMLMAGSVLDADGYGLKTLMDSDKLGSFIRNVAYSTEGHRILAFVPKSNFAIATVEIFDPLPSPVNLVSKFTYTMTVPSPWNGSRFTRADAQLYLTNTSRFDGPEDLDLWITADHFSVADDGSGGNGVAQGQEGSDAVLAREVSIESDTRYLQFDYHFVKPGNGDRLVAMINGIEVWAKVGSDYVGTGMTNTGLIDVGAYAGTSVGLELRLATVAPSTGDDQAVIWLDNIAFLPGASDLSLTSASVPESFPAGTSVGILSTALSDMGGTVTYSLISGEGSDDNGEFEIVGRDLVTASVLDYEARAERSIRVLATDSSGASYERVFTISVTNVDEAPTDIAMAGDSVVENLGAGTIVGWLSAADPDLGETFVYALVDTTAYPDNAWFGIDGSQLRTAAIFDYELKNSYSICVRATDQGGLWFEKAFTVTVTDVNETPTDITLPASSVAENLPSDTAIGTFTTTDPDTGDTFTYSLVGGTGSTDNTSFTISGGTLQTAAAFDYEAKNSYSIRLRSTDQGGLWFEKVITINVTDVDDTAPAITGVTGPADGWYRIGQPLNFTVNFSENVMVSGVSTIGLTIGSTSRSASYLSGSGSSSLVFGYAVQAGDNDGDGIALASPLVLNGGTIQDAGSNWAALSFAPPVTTGVRVDTVAPTVTAVYVRGTSWASGYLSFLAANMSGSSVTYGYAIPVGSGAAQLQTLPWRNLNRISIAFSEDVSIAQAQFAIVGSVGSYSISGFSYSSADHVATWSLSAAIGPDKLYVALTGSGSGPVTDLAGNALDGEWSNPSSYGDASSTSVFPSGNGTAGGDFAFRFDVLPGDSSGGSLGKVNVADVAQTKTRSNLPVSTVTYRSDFDGNNLVNVADVAYVKTKSSLYALPVNPPVVPVFGAVFSQVRLLISRENLLLVQVMDGESPWR